MDHEIEPTSDSNSVLPFQDLVAPQPIKSTPPPTARWLAFAAILLGGGLGAALGFGIGDIMGGSSEWGAVGALLGGLTGAIGVAVVANLALRAMNEWRAVEHPEAASGADTKPDSNSKPDADTRPDADTKPDTGTDGHPHD